MGVGGQRHAPAALPLGKTRNPLHRILSGPQCRSERVQKISPATGIPSPDRLARSEHPKVTMKFISGFLRGESEIFTLLRC